ncbi:MAG: hypothetical protein GX444_08665 [Myxococcales bacterium]|nr:hypothetical protein [Myxococcales bacterium]
MIKIVAQRIDETKMQTIKDDREPQQPKEQSQGSAFHRMFLDPDGFGEIKRQKGRGQEVIDLVRSLKKIKADKEQNQSGKNDSGAIASKGPENPEEAVKKQVQSEKNADAAMNNQERVIQEIQFFPEHDP